MCTARILRSKRFLKAKCNRQHLHKSFPSRRPSAVREKTPEIDPLGSLVVGLVFPHLERLAFGTGHRQTRNRHCLASRWLSPVLDLEGATGPTRTTSHSPRGPRSDPQDVPRESRLGCTPHPR